jgi:hypothetical protein
VTGALIELWSIDHIVEFGSMSDLITHGLRLHLVGENSDLLAERLGVLSAPLAESDGAIFIVSAKNGISRSDSQKWHEARELYIPSVVVISDLAAENETDFEDMALIAGKILDPVVTPYLVLHLDDGTPAALIDLQTQKLHVYLAGAVEIRESEPEHREVVAEFRDEYVEMLESAGEAAFENALIYPALPWIESNDLGLAEIIHYLNRIPITR